MKRIIILERLNEPSDASYKVAYWLDIPLGRQTFFANPSATSEVKTITAAELQDIRDGKVFEKVEAITLDEKATVEDIKFQLNKRLDDLQNNFNIQNPFILYGTYMDDGKIWIKGGVK